MVTEIQRRRSAGEKIKPIGDHFGIDKRKATPNPVTVRVHPTTAAVVDGTMSPGERIILTALVQFGSSDSDQLGVLTSYKTTSRYEYCRKLAAKGYIDNSGPLLKPTQAGIDALGSSYEPLPTGRKLYEWWCQRLGGAELKLLQFLVDKKYGKAATFEELEEAANIKATSRYEYVRKLKARRLVATTGREVLATESLF
jgi:hypothetical protein